MKPGFTFFTAAALFATLAMATPRRPWRFRKNPAVETYHITAHQNIQPNLWPQEPASPVEVTPQQFQNALGRVKRNKGDIDKAALRVKQKMFLSSENITNQRHFGDLF